MMRRIAFMLLTVMLVCGARPAAAERLVVSLSNHAGGDHLELRRR